VPKLSPLSFNELIRRLRKFGFEGPYGGGKHLYMIKENLRLNVPNPHSDPYTLLDVSRIIYNGSFRSRW